MFLINQDFDEAYLDEEEFFILLHVVEGKRTITAPIIGQMFHTGNMQDLILMSPDGDIPIFVIFGLQSRRLTVYVIFLEFLYLKHMKLS